MYNEYNAHIKQRKRKLYYNVNTFLRYVLKDYCKLSPACWHKKKACIHTWASACVILGHHSSGNTFLCLYIYRHHHNDLGKILLTCRHCLDWWATLHGWFRDIGKVPVLRFQIVVLRRSEECTVTTFFVLFLLLRGAQPLPLLLRQSPTHLWLWEG